MRKQDNPTFRYFDINYVDVIPNDYEEYMLKRLKSVKHDRDKVIKALIDIREQLLTGQLILNKAYFHHEKIPQDVDIYSVWEHEWNFCFGTSERGIKNYKVCAYRF